MDIHRSQWRHQKFNFTKILCDVQNPIFNIHWNFHVDMSIDSDEATANSRKFLEIKKMLF